MKLRAGVDLFIDRRDGNPDQIAAVMQSFDVAGTKLTTISNRGTKVWPNGNPDTYWSDHWCCRFEGDGETFNAEHVVELLSRGRKRRVRRDQDRGTLHVQRRARLLASPRRVD